MGINDEYSRDSYIGDQYAYNSDGDADDFDSKLDPEDWQDVYSQELLNGWMTIRMWYEERYMTVPSSFHAFVQFVLEPEQWFTHDPPSFACTMFWTEISKIRVISDRVVSEQFTGWFKHNIEIY